MRILGFAPTGEWIVQEILRRARRQRVHIASDAAVDVDPQVRRAWSKRSICQLRILQLNTHGQSALAGKGIFVGQPERDRGHDETPARGQDLERVNPYLRSRIQPAPQTVPARPALGDFSLAEAGGGPWP